MNVWRSWVPGLAEFTLGLREARTRGLARDTRVRRGGLAQPVTLAAAALLAGLVPASWVGESSASNARLIVA